MNNSIRYNTNCSGCGVCKNVCPKDAISMQHDSKGFLRPVVNDNCIECGLCVKYCHEHKKNDGFDVQKTYTAYSNHADIRAVSSSGGIFTALAQDTINRDGFVCAAGFDSDFYLRHHIIDNFNQLDFLRKSKYLESDISEIWAEIKLRISSGQKGLFVGTPCQCAALRNILRDRIDNIITCDFICHGVASPAVFDKYKKYLGSKYGTPIKIEFRHKENGEGSYFYYVGKCGEYMIPNYSRSYPYAYASGLIIADDCTSCRYCSLRRNSDITLGDYVNGPTDYSKSTIFANTSKGIEILKNCKGITIIEENLDNTIQKSWHLTTPNTPSSQRDRVFKDLSQASWEYLENTYFKPLNRFQLYRLGLINHIKKIINW